MRCIRDFGVTFGGDRDYASTGFFYLAQVADGLFSAQHGLRIVQVARGDAHDGNVFVDECVRTMLDFAGGIAFRVNVGSFFQLERAIESNGIVHVAPDVEEVFDLVVLLRQLVAEVVLVQNGLDFVRKSQEFVHQSGNLLIGERAACFAEVDGEEVKRNQLRAKCLGRCDADFRSGLRMDDGVGFARDGGIQNIGDSQGAGSARLREPLRA